MANTVIIQTVTFLPDDVAIVTGTVNGTASKAQTWQSAISKLPSTAAVQTFLGQNLINAAIPPTSTVINTYNGTIII